MRAVITVEDRDNLLELFKDYEEKGSRSSTKISSKQGKVTFTVDADDSVALRATLNSITKLLTVHENMRGI